MGDDHATQPNVHVTQSAIDMASRRPRFSIRSIMIATAVVAILFAPPTGFALFAIILSIPAFAGIYASWMARNHHRKLAAYSFGIIATLANTSLAFACIAPDGYVRPVLFLGSMFIVGPTIAGLGAAWAALATRQTAKPVRHPLMAILPVIAFSILPVCTVASLWPFHITYVISMNALHKLADQVAASKPMTFPQQSGLFRIAAARVDPDTGNIALLIDPDPNGPTGFVRVNPGRPADEPYRNYRPIRGDILSVPLGGDWWYNEED